MSMQLNLKYNEVYPYKTSKRTTNKPKKKVDIDKKAQKRITKTRATKNCGEVIEK
jgi:N-acetylmuramoyl-L-alanine amidase CwlA